MTEVVEGHRRAKIDLHPRIEYSNAFDSAGSCTDDLAKLRIRAADAGGLIAARNAVSEDQCTCQCGIKQAVDSERWTLRRSLTALALKEMLLNDVTVKPFAANHLLHVAFMETLPLGLRRVRFTDPGEDKHPGLQPFLSMTIEVLLSIIQDEEFWKVMEHQGPCDVADLVDGRLWLAATVTDVNWDSDSALRLSFEQQAHILCALTGIHLRPENEGSTKKPAISPINGLETSQSTILPFSNAVFNRHLAPIKLATTSTKSAAHESGKIFREVSHWHNAKRRITTKVVAPLSGKDRMKVARRNDNFMAEMQSYAASLTNATGKSLEPEIVTVGGTGMIQDIGKENAPTSKPVPRQAVPKAAQRNKGGKKQVMREEIAANRAVKDSDNVDKVYAAWRMVRKNLESERSLVSKYHKIRGYLRDLPDQKRRIVGAEVELHLACILVEIYWETCRGQDLSKVAPSAETLGVRALLWDTVRKIPLHPGFSKAIANKTKEILKSVAIPGIDLPKPTEDRPLTCDPRLLLPKEVTAVAQVDGQQFQLLYCGPYMDRNLDSVRL